MIVYYSHPPMEGFALSFHVTSKRELNARNLTAAASRAASGLLAVEITPSGRDRGRCPHAPAGATWFVYRVTAHLAFANSLGGTIEQVFAYTMNLVTETVNAAVKLEQEQQILSVLKPAEVDNG